MLIDTFFSPHYQQNHQYYKPLQMYQELANSTDSSFAAQRKWGQMFLECSSTYKGRIAYLKVAHIAHLVQESNIVELEILLMGLC